MDIGQVWSTMVYKYFGLEQASLPRVLAYVGHDIDNVSAWKMTTQG